MFRTDVTFDLRNSRSTELTAQVRVSLLFIFHRCHVFDFSLYIIIIIIISVIIIIIILYTEKYKKAKVKKFRNIQKPEE